MDLSHIRSKARLTFLREYVDTGDAVRAARFAGYDKGDERRLKIHASNLKSQLKEEIDGLMKEKLSGVGPKALTVMEDLMERSESDSVRFNAARDLLDRSGWKSSDGEMDVKKTVEEMEAQLVALVGSEGANVLLAKVRTTRTVTPASEALPVIN